MNATHSVSHSVALLTADADWRPAPKELTIASLLSAIEGECGAAGTAAAAAVALTFAAADAFAAARALSRAMRCRADFCACSRIARSCAGVFHSQWRACVDAANPAVAAAAPAPLEVAAALIIERGSESMRQSCSDEIELGSNSSRAEAAVR